MSVDIAEGNYEVARDDATQLLQHAHASGSGLAIALAMARLGEVTIATGDAQAAVELLGPFVESSREGGMPYFVAASALVLISAQRRVGDLAGATTLIDEVTAMVDGLGNAWMSARLELERGLIALESDDLQAAGRHIHSSLTTFARMGQRPYVACVLDALGLLAVAAGQGAEAVRTFAAASALRAAMRIVSSPPDAVSVSDACDGLRSSLGLETFEYSWNDGAAMSVDDILQTLHG